MSDSSARKITPNDSSGNVIAIERANGPLKHRHELLCHMAAAGVKAQQIAADLGYNKSHVSVILNHPGTQARIQKIWDAHLHFRDDAKTAFERANVRGMEITNEILDSNAPLYQRWKVAKWIAEKKTGRARTQSEASGKIDHMALFDALDRMKAEHAAELSRIRTEHEAGERSRNDALTKLRDDYRQLLADTKAATEGNGNSHTP